ncbi:hypothetical protein B0J13DRAFT_676544 [Dactylonectria estremocensis]|uniref:Uncharacterized protein n=1 Tax=Dactylonectria estremocensis TaxID=1079267 RepID=A0A9P9J2W9_9HYPO|nr:hypothetical protein B0J13DRAFT_676544 [Dactylonectria estremocensis]
MMHLVLLLSLLARVWASPTPETELSIWDDDSIPVVDQPDLDFFNSTALARDVGIEKRALDLTYTLYDVIFNGLNQGNFEPFRVQGELMFIKKITSPGTQNGANPVDVVISIGNPIINPIAGSIRYVTNRYLNPFIGGSKDTTRTDLAYVSRTSTTVKVKIDPYRTYANAYSTFNARSGVFSASVFKPASGNFYFVLKNGKISGNINIVGKDGVTTAARAPYKAIVGGKAKQKGKITL